MHVDHCNALETLSCGPLAISSPTPELRDVVHMYDALAFSFGLSAIDGSDGTGKSGNSVSYDPASLSTSDLRAAQGQHDSRRKNETYHCWLSFPLPTIAARVEKSHGQAG